MKAHFVTFMSPGTFFHETTTVQVDSWDTDAAKEMAKDIKELHGATPFGFQFTTKAREDHELDSTEVDRSPMYYLGGRVETLEEIEARNSPGDSILLGNMRCNGYDRVLTNENSWKVTMPLRDGDIILEWP